VRGTEQLEAINIAELAGMFARAIAAALNERKVPTPAGGEWHSVTIIRGAEPLIDAGAGNLVA
jgi:hypothetical protein